mmetsp:Transcript_30553/g.61155  ORF Transcript_30553/g.61155 Transcript_30553/m.61155 type:complete len:112 (-) Transcript_30553:25-360(-)
MCCLVLARNEPLSWSKNLLRGSKNGVCSPGAPFASFRGATDLSKNGANTALLFSPRPGLASGCLASVSLEINIAAMQQLQRNLRANMMMVHQRILSTPCPTKQRLLPQVTS